MPKKHKFTPRTSDLAKLNKLNKSTKRKKKRLSNLFNVQPDIEVKDIDSFQSRKEFNKYIKDLETFTDRKNFRYVKNKYEVVASRDELNDLKKKISEINKSKRKEYNKIKNKTFKSRGKNTFEKVNDRKLMGDTRFDEFREKTFNFDRFRNKKELSQFVGDVNKQVDKKYTYQKHLTYKENFIIGLENVFGKMATNLIKKVESMPLEDFMLIYYTEDIANIDFMYEYIDMLRKLSELNNVFGL